MNQLKQIVCAASIAVAFGTIVNGQASAAVPTAQAAMFYQGIAIAQFKPLVRTGSGGGNATQSLSREDAAQDRSAIFKDRQWFSRAAHHGQAQVGLEMLAGCAGYPTCADTLLDKAKRARAQSLAISWKFAENLSNAWVVDYDAPASAFTTPAGLRNNTRSLSLAPLEVAADVHAESALLRAALSSIMWALFAYAAYLATLALFQRRFVFNPTQAVGPAAEPADTHEITSVRLALAHNKAIKGWFLRPRQGKALCPSIIYYGGRSEEVSWLQGAVKWFPNHAVLVLNYRGYGESEGDPSERGLFEDGLAQFDWLAAQPGVNPKAIVLVGRSLGTGVASYVAAKRPAERVVLITPYDSLLAVARRRFWFTPLSLLLRHKFKSVDYARTNMQPCLALLAEHDDVVPEEHTHRLMASWAGAKKLVRIPSTNHMDIPYQAATLTAVAAWLGYASVPPGPLSLVAHLT
jgi:uncharacterized protein